MVLIENTNKIQCTQTLNCYLPGKPFSLMKHKKAKSLLLVSLISLVFSGFSTGCSQPEPKVEYVPLAKERVSHETNLVWKANAPQPYDNRVPPGGMAVTYQSRKMDMKGWLFVPGRENKRPAVLYAHSGYSIDKYDAEAIRPFLEAGYVVFVPAWRAENGNPGSFEMCYGEVVDAVNALNWLSNRPEVDSNEIYGAGNGVGATIIWLLAEMSPKLKKVAAFGAFPSMLRVNKTYSEPPFSVQDKTELKLRSPGEYLQDLKCPLMLLYESGDPEDEAYLAQAKELIDENKAKIKEPIEIHEMVGADHKTRPASAMSRMITFFSSD